MTINEKSNTQSKEENNMRNSYTHRYKNEEEVKEDKVAVEKVKANFKRVAFVTALVGTGYLLGGIKGYKLGFKVGKNVGQAKGYEKAHADVSKMVSDAVNAVVNDVE